MRTSSPLCRDNRRKQVLPHRNDESRYNAVNKHDCCKSTNTPANPSADHFPTYKSVCFETYISKDTHLNILPLHHLLGHHLPPQHTQPTTCQDTHHNPENTNIKIQQPFLCRLQCYHKQNINNYKLGYLSAWYPVIIPKIKKNGGEVAKFRRVQEMTSQNSSVWSKLSLTRWL